MRILIFKIILYFALKLVIPTFVQKSQSGTEFKTTMTLFFSDFHCQCTSLNLGVNVGSPSEITSDL